MHQMDVVTANGLISANNQGKEDLGSNAITEIEKLKFINNRGRTAALAQSLAECYGISPKNIEIGNSTIGKYGVSTHVVHYVYEEDLLLDNCSQDLGKSIAGEIAFAPIVSSS